jgi:hypothetical protein
MHRLRANQPDFTVMEGAFENKAYRRGQAYAEIPPEHADRFEEIEEEKPAEKSKAARATPEHEAHRPLAADVAKSALEGENQ